MRHFKTAMLASVFALIATASSAGTGHWFCTSDGIRSWTSDAGKMDAKGWSYSGDRAKYDDGGHCAKS